MLNSAKVPLLMTNFISWLNGVKNIHQVELA
ncbi:hypothetical protein A1C_04085 [Rickettsia akari str. Hartford]|uniref:Uncharacterized protein n=1 Tax=Rickettsia akari (strain Hartford) TaxID=293614 RepID=A8GNW5_RICAH|nr:hypothetical protein A1C_04085 [Rickettsia akari str. Hartford]